MHCWVGTVYCALYWVVVGTVRGVVARDVYIYIYIMENIKKKKKEGKVIKYMYTLRRYFIGRSTLTSVGVCT